MALSTPSLPISLGIGWAFDRLTVPTMEYLLSKGCLGDLAFNTLVKNKELCTSTF